MVMRGLNCSQHGPVSTVIKAAELSVVLLTKKDSLTLAMVAELSSSNRACRIEDLSPATKFPSLLLALDPFSLSVTAASLFSIHANALLCSETSRQRIPRSRLRTSMRDFSQQAYFFFLRSSSLESATLRPQLLVVPVLAKSSLVLFALETSDGQNQHDWLHCALNRETWLSEGVGRIAGY
jgi:hypothetical protein